VFAAMIRASGRVPQISVVVGPAAGGAAYGPALTDLVIMAPAGRIFVTGPNVVKSVTGEEIDQESLGGARAHGTKSGVVHVIAADEQDAYQRARRLISLLGRPGLFDLGAMSAILARSYQTSRNGRTTCDRWCAKSLTSITKAPASSRSCKPNGRPTSSSG
jgi:acetyl-CoA carboxylase carboxyltransferase component